MPHTVILGPYTSIHDCREMDLRIKFEGDN